MNGLTRYLNHKKKTSPQAKACVSGFHPLPEVRL
jgi:hypothetical protein